MAMHNIEYCATASPSNMPDFVAKVKRGLEASKNGFAYLHVFSPCPTGWSFKPDESIAVARRAVQSNAFPLWECDRGKYYMTENRSPITIAEFVRGIGKFNKLTDEDIAELQKEADARYDMIKRLCGK